MLTALKGFPGSQRVLPQTDYLEILLAGVGKGFFSSSRLFAVTLNLLEPQRQVLLCVGERCWLSVGQQLIGLLLSHGYFLTNNC